MNLDFTQYLGIFSVIIAVLVPIVLYYLQTKRNKKSIVYETLYEEEVLSDSLKTISQSIGEIKKNEIIEVDSFEVKINGKTISNLWIVEILFSNNGYKHIDKSDFEDPILIQVPENSKIISATATLIKPSKEILKLKLKKQAIIIEPLLINSTDYFAVKMLLNNHTKKALSIKSRIRGISQIKEHIIIGRKYFIAFLLSAALIILYFSFEVFREINSESFKFQNPFDENYNTTNTPNKTRESIFTILGLIYIVMYTLLITKTSRKRERIRRLINN